MSSRSLPPRAADVVIVGSSWQARLAAHYAVETGRKVLLLQTPDLPQPTLLPVHVGTGEPRQRVELAMGAEITQKLWSLSQKNLTSAEKLIGKKAEPKLFWKGKEEREELCLLVDTSELLGRLRPPTMTAPAAKTPRLRSVGRLDYEVETESEIFTSSLVVAADDATLLDWCPAMKEELIPVTLSVFEEKAVMPLEEGYYLFHGGADFALKRGDDLILGSYRNLFEDKGVGFLSQYDPKSWEGIQSFFGQLGWIRAAEKPHRFTPVFHSVTCDGLPLIGASRDIPGLFMATGFSGRPQNFLFETLRLLMESLLTGRVVELPFSSNKRFV